jgi:oligopeptide transport system ATP-binding protein
MMEQASRDALYAAPRHPYTRALIAAVPIPDPRLERHKRRVALKGDLPSPLDPPSGCVFRTRCPLAIQRCADETPAVDDIAPGHRVACHRWREVGTGP